MTHPPTSHSPPTAPKRPRGILKNSNSFQNTAPDPHTISPASAERPPLTAVESTDSTSALPTTANPNAAASRPSAPNRELSEKEIVSLNTNLNAGHRRSSSNVHRTSSTRRQSSISNTDMTDSPDQPRLKWDEANLYLNEGQMGGKMKIDEPKTPFAPSYDPAEDAEELGEGEGVLGAEGLAVDELDMRRGSADEIAGGGVKRRERDIPDLELGEPSMDVDSGAGVGGGAQKVEVQSSGDAMDVDGGAGSGMEGVGGSAEEREKHAKFEAMRKKHYEMKNVKGLLGHPEELEAMDDEEDEGKR